MNVCRTCAAKHPTWDGPMHTRPAGGGMCRNTAQVRVKTPEGTPLPKALLTAWGATNPQR